MAVPSDVELVHELLMSWVGEAAQAVRDGRDDHAEAIYRRWIEFLPQDPRPKYGLADLLLRQGKYEEGFRLYEARTEIPQLGITRPVYCAPD